MSKKLVALASIALLTSGLFLTVASASRARLDDAEMERTRLDNQKLHLNDQLVVLNGGAGSTETFPPGLIWPGSDKAAVERALQSSMLQLGEQQRLSLSAFSSASGPVVQTSATVAFQLEGTAEWQSLMRFIDAVLTHSPAIGVSDLSIRTGAAGPAQNQEVIFRILVWGFAPGLGEPS